MLVPNPSVFWRKNVLPDFLDLLKALVMDMLVISHPKRGLKIRFTNPIDCCISSAARVASAHNVDVSLQEHSGGWLYDWCIISPNSLLAVSQNKGSKQMVVVVKAIFLQRLIFLQKLHDAFPHGARGCWSTIYTKNFHLVSNTVIPTISFCWSGRSEAEGECFILDMLA